MIKKVSSLSASEIKSLSATIIWSIKCEPIKSRVVIKFFVIIISSFDGNATPLG